MQKKLLINTQQNAQACTNRYYEVSRSDLPLSCPPRHLRLWDAHPKIYLPIEDTGECLCPYCGTKYVLKEFVPPPQE